MLLRLDPDKDAIAVMSIPRDLKVEIPGYGTGKFNEAYAYGGPKLTLQTVKELTGLPINHVVNVDFLGFVRAVDAIGCVYVDVDRRYFHSNAGLPPSEQYSEINVQPGYQLLCGKKALQYVRYRHTDTDIVRSARQQDFISAARQRISVQDLVFDQSDLIDIFTEYTTSDISDGKTMLRSAETVRSPRATRRSTRSTSRPNSGRASSTRRRKRSTKRSTCSSAIETTERRLARLARRQPKPARRRAARSGKKREEAEEEAEAEGRSRKPPGSDGLVPAARSGRSRGRSRRRASSAPASPSSTRRRLPPGAHYVESDRYEHVVRSARLPPQGRRRRTPRRLPDGRRRWNSSDGTHYFGVQGIQGWSDPPILDNPSLTKTIHGREYDIYVDGDRVKMIAWHRGDNTYWISNDLLQTLTNDQMVGMARSADVIIPKKKPKQGGKKR